MRFKNPNTLATPIMVDRKELSRALDMAIKALDPVSRAAYVQSAKMRSHGDCTEIVTGNFDVEFSTLIPSLGGETGTYCLSARQLQQIAKKSKALDATLTETGNNSVLVQMGAMSATLESESLEDFPTIEPINGDRFTAVYKAPELLQALQRCFPCISKEETRHYLNGVAWDHKPQSDNENSSTAFIATDGHRLAKCDLVPFATNGHKLAYTTIIPAKTAKLVIDILKHRQGPKGFVSIEVTPSKIEFRLGDDIVLSKLIDGTFPDYNRVIPVVAPMNFTMSKSDLQNAIDAMAGLTTTKGAAMAFGVGEDSVTVSINKPELGETQATYAATREHSGYKGANDDFRVGYNSKYLNELVKLFKGNSVTFQMGGTCGPAIICDDQNCFLLVLMPMRV